MWAYVITAPITESQLPEAQSSLQVPADHLSLLDLDASDTSTDTALAVPLAHVTLNSDESDPLDPVSPDLQHALVMDDSHQFLGNDLLSSSV